MDNIVYVVKCENYGKAQEKIAELFELMGGIGRFAKSNEKITLKTNLLCPADPEKAVSTHPEIVAAIGSIVKKEGAIPLIADSPGSGYRYTESTLKKLYTTCKMYEAAEKAGIEVNMDLGYEKISYPQGKQIKRMDVISPVLNADGVFNLCKMKTHMLMHMTGAVKNLFGIIPGLSKITYHAKLLNKKKFADMLLDLALFASPRLSVMDAVLAMEGEGPGVSGTPRHIGLLLASTNPLALDAAAGEIMGLPRIQNPVLMAAQRRGLTGWRIEDVTVVGAELSSLKIPDYKFTSTVKKMNQFPFVLKEKCTCCGVCRDSCPQKAINIDTQGKKQALIDTKNCIRCYCCHELCPQGAVEVKRNR